MTIEGKDASGAFRATDTFLRTPTGWRVIALKIRVQYLSTIERAANMRMKLTTCGGRLRGKRSILIAAAAGCSLCAIR
jgi:hypothetical protein